MEYGARLQNGFTFLEELPFDLLYSEYYDHKRLIVFVTHGLECLCCGELGTRLVKSHDNGGGIHIDIYSDQWVLMTVDHVIARSKGGGEDVSNKQPLCSYCNFLKDSDDLDIAGLREKYFSLRERYLSEAYILLLRGAFADTTTCNLIQFRGRGGVRGSISKKYIPPAASMKKNRSRYLRSNKTSISLLQA